MPRLILINEPSIAQELGRSFVRREGFELIEIAGGLELLESASTQGGDLVIASTVMPDVSGAELCARLRDREMTRTIPVLLIGSPSEREESEAAGASAFLSTPWTSRELLGAVRSFLPVVERAADRAAVSLKVICGEGAESHVAFTKDISATGLFLKGASLASPGTRMRIRLRLPGDGSGEELDLSAEVVRRDSPQGDRSRTAGLGLRFLDFPLMKRVPINRFVRESSAR